MSIRSKESQVVLRNFKTVTSGDFVSPNSSVNSASTTSSRMGLFKDPYLATINGHKNYRGRCSKSKNVQRTPKQSGGQRKRSPRKMVVLVAKSSGGGAKWSRRGAKFTPAGGCPR